MIKKVAAYIKEHHMISAGAHICVGVSGGADSVCLFLVLRYLQDIMDFTMSVVHIEHGIRGEESLSDMAFVKQIAGDHGVEFSAYSYPVEQIARGRGLSVEEAGRMVRYEAFEKKCAAYGASAKIALAHHADDSAETMLFHLCRGSGIEGLCGIRPVRGNVIRPLLCVTRDEIEDFLSREGQPYRMDATNEDVAYSRNRIRNLVMPELGQINERYMAHMNCLAEDAAEISAYFREEAEKILARHMTKGDGDCLGFELPGFFEYPSVLQKRVLLELLAKAGDGRKDIGREHVRSLLNLAEGRTGRKINLPYGVIGEKTYGKILLYKEKKQEKKTASIRIPLMDIPGEIQIPTGRICLRLLNFSKKDAEIPRNVYTKWFDYDKIKDRLYFRTREAGDYFVLDEAGHRKKLKDYWIDEKVPGSKREQILLLAEGHHILWVIGGRISAGYKITRETNTILEVQFMEEKHGGNSSGIINRRRSG